AANRAAAAAPAPSATASAEAAEATATAGTPSANPAMNSGKALKYAVISPSSIPCAATRYRMALSTPAAIAASMLGIGGMDHGSRHRTVDRLLDDVRQQRQEASPLDCLRQFALLLRRNRGDAARHDLA